MHDEEFHQRVVKILKRISKLDAAVDTACRTNDLLKLKIEDANLIT